MLKRQLAEAQARLASIEEDGTSEHNAAVQLRRDLAEANARADKFEAAFSQLVDSFANLQVDYEVEQNRLESELARARHYVDDIIRVLKFHQPMSGLLPPELLAAVDDYGPAQFAPGGLLSPVVLRTLALTLERYPERWATLITAKVSDHEMKLKVSDDMLRAMSKAGYDAFLRHTFDIFARAFSEKLRTP